MGIDNVLRDLTKAIELDKKFYQAYYNRGSIYSRLGENRLAEKGLEKAKVLTQAEIEETSK